MVQEENQAISPNTNDIIAQPAQQTNKLQELFLSLTTEVIHLKSSNKSSTLDDDRGLKFKVSEFDGQGDTDTYLEWELALERYFEYKGTSDERKYKIAVAKLSKYASIWYEGVKRQRKREGKSKIETWEKFKKVLRRRFVPPTFQLELYVKLATLKQGKMSVEDYTKEFEKVSIQCRIEEREEQKIARFVGGLDQEFIDKIELHPHLPYDEICKMASKLDKQRKRNHKFAPKSYVPYKPTPHPLQPPTSDAKKQIMVHKDKGKTKEGSSSDVPKIQCFKCKGFGHYKGDCTKEMEECQKEEGEESHEEENQEEEEEEICKPEYEIFETNNLVLERAFHVKSVDYSIEQDTISPKDEIKIITLEYPMDKDSPMVVELILQDDVISMLQDEEKQVAHDNSITIGNYSHTASTVMAQGKLEDYFEVVSKQDADMVVILQNQIDTFVQQHALNVHTYVSALQQLVFDVRQHFNNKLCKVATLVRPQQVLFVDLGRRIWLISWSYNTWDKCFLRRGE